MSECECAKYPPNDIICDIWHINDIKQQIDEYHEQCPDDGYDTLTDEDARDILVEIDGGRDASIGINWDVIDFYIAQTLETKKQIARSKSE